MLGFKVCNSDITRDRSTRGMLWLGSSLAILLVLLPLISFAQTHLWKFQSFRAFDTGHSGGDHICDLRRDSNGLGRPDRLGDYVTFSGTVIAEPSTYETGGWLFWVRQAGCGMLVYGEQESLDLGDSVRVRGWLRLTNGDFFFPETGLATLGDVAIENAGVRVIGRADCVLPTVIPASEITCAPERYGGDLVCVQGLTSESSHVDHNGDSFVWLRGGLDSVLVYVDGDTDCRLDPDAPDCLAVTGILVRMETPPGVAPSPSWCIAPRRADDITVQSCGSSITSISWGAVKRDFMAQD